MSYKRVETSISKSSKVNDRLRDISRESDIMYHHLPRVNFHSSGQTVRFIYKKERK